MNHISPNDTIFNKTFILFNKQITYTGNKANNTLLINTLPIENNIKSQNNNEYFFVDKTVRYFDGKVELSNFIATRSNLNKIFYKFDNNMYNETHRELHYSQVFNKTEHCNKSQNEDHMYMTHLINNKFPSLRSPKRPQVIVTHTNY